MFTNFFMGLRDAQIPVSLTEYLTLLEAVKAGVASALTEAVGWSALAFFESERVHTWR